MPTYHCLNPPPARADRCSLREHPKIHTPDRCRDRVSAHRPCREGLSGTARPLIGRERRAGFSLAERKACWPLIGQTRRPNEDGEGLSCSKADGHVGCCGGRHHANARGHAAVDSGRPRTAGYRGDASRGATACYESRSVQRDSASGRVAARSSVVVRMLLSRLKEWTAELY